MGDDVEIIGDKAFQNCTGIKDIKIPAKVNLIGNQAFDNCERLRKVTALGDTPPSISSSSFPNRANQTLYVNKGCKSAYEDADYWWEFKEIIEQGDSQESIKGDMNNDGEVNVTDVMMLVDIILKKQ